jgi:hypothetical protein
MIRCTADRVSGPGVWNLVLRDWADEGPGVGVLTGHQVGFNGITRVVAQRPLNPPFGLCHLHAQHPYDLAVTVNQLVPAEPDDVTHAESGGCHQPD